MTKPRCNTCKKIITGSVRLVTSRKKSGNKVLNVVDYYDEKCFKLYNKQRALNGSGNQKRTNQKTNS